MNTDADRMNESDDDNTLPPPTPCRAAAAPNQIAVKSEEPLEVKVKLIKSEPDDDNALPLPAPTQQPYAAGPIKPEPLEVDAPDAPRRLVTPGPPANAKPPARRTTRSSGSSSDVIDDEAIAATRKIEFHNLRKRGWVYKADKIHTWMWIPQSLATFKVEEILKCGEDGVHFARGDIGLCKMLQTYGLYHAPEDLDDFPQKNSFDIFELKDRVEKDLEEASKKAKSSHAAEPSGAQAIPTPARKRAKKSKPASKEELINENARLKDELARKDDELAQLRLKWEQKWEQVQKVVGAPL